MQALIHTSVLKCTNLKLEKRSTYGVNNHREPQRLFDYCTNTRVGLLPASIGSQQTLTMARTITLSFTHI